MKKLSKRLQKLNNLVEKKLYSVDESIKLLKETATASFVESTEAHISLNIDPKYADQQLRTTLVLPNGTGKTVRLAVLIPDEKIKPEYKQQADIVGSNDLIEKITKGDIDFDILIASPDMMPKLAKLCRVLGPKGLMPSPKSGNVTDDISETINQFKKGKIEYKADRTGIVHLNFGKSNFTNEQLLQNLLAFYNSVEQNKPSGVKGKYFKSFYICNTMGPSIQIDLTSMV